MSNFRLFQYLLKSFQFLRNSSLNISGDMFTIDLVYKNKKTNIWNHFEPEALRDGDGVSSAGEIDVTLFWWLVTLCCGNPVTLFWWLVTLCWTPRAGNCGRAFVTSGWGKWKDPKFEESWKKNFTVNIHITVFFYEFHYGFQSIQFVS